jgi:excisionase family DNA binding protein
MSTIKIKQSLASGGRCTLAHPGAEIGWHDGLFIGGVRNVPEGVTAASVVRLYEQTTFWPWKTICDYSELGYGKIITDRRATMTVLEVAAHLGVSADRVRKLIADKRLPAQKRGRDWAISALDLPLVEDRKPGRPKADTDD